MRRRHAFPDLGLLLRRTVLTIFVLGLGALFIRGYAGWIEDGSALTLSRLEVEGNDFFKTQEILDQGGIQSSANLHRLALEGVQARLEANPFLESVQVHKTYPNRLVLRVAEKQPVALLSVEGALYCIDRDGLVLPARPGRLYQLPLISGRFEGGVQTGVRAGGRWVEEGLSLIRTVLAERPELYDKISEVVVGHPKGMLVYTADCSVPVWFGTGGVSEKIRYLEAIYAELSSKNQFQQVKYIDLRYEDQVVLGMRS